MALDHAEAVTAHDKLLSLVEGTLVGESRLVAAGTVLCFDIHMLVLVENCHGLEIGILPFCLDALAVRNGEMIPVIDHEKHGLKAWVGCVNALLGDNCFHEELSQVAL